MKGAAKALIGILETENTSLAALDFPRAATMLDRKTALLAALAADPDAAALIPALAALAATNRQLLEHAIMVQNRVLGTVAQAIARSLPPTGFYGSERLGSRPRAPALVLSTAG